MTGNFKVFVSQNFVEPGLEVLNLSATKSYCAWSAPLLIDLNTLGFTPGQTYYLRLKIGLNSHALYAYKIIPVAEIGVQSTTWGAIKELFRP